MSFISFYERILAKLPTIIAIFVIIFVNWFFQDLLLSDRSEKKIKVSVDLILTFVFAIILTTVIPLRIAIIIAFVVAHSFNWIFNTNIYASRIKKYGIIEINFEKIMSFLKYLQKKLQKQKGISGAAIYGSMSTGKFHKNSDIDVKFFKRCGFINSVRACLFLCFIRTKANLSKFPLEVYLMDSINNYKLKKDEVPVILYDPDQVVENSYDKVSYLKERTEEIHNNLVGR